MIKKKFNDIFCLMTMDLVISRKGSEYILIVYTNVSFGDNILSKSETLEINIYLSQYPLRISVNMSKVYNSGKSLGFSQRGLYGP